MRNDSGQVVAFEIDNIYASRRTICKLLQAVDGVTDVALASAFGGSDDVRVRFDFHNRQYVVVEPFGDNSRYWVGPANNDSPSESVAPLERAFSVYRPPAARKIIGDLLTLRFLSRWR
ncbi:hypothetical protein RHOFW510R12_01280 [Rhodanobacter sp. FW510-R12]